MILNQFAKITLAAIVMLFVSAALAVGQTPQDPGTKGTRSSMYNPKTEATISGVVQEIKEVPGPGRSSGLHLTVKADAAVYEVHVGPMWYLNQQKYSFAKGERIEVIGSNVTFQGADAMIARRIKKGEETWTLRDEQGIPAWSRRVSR